MVNSATSQDNQRDRLTMNEVLQSLRMSMLSQKFEDEWVDFNVIMSASDEHFIRLGVRTIGDRVRLRDACRRIYTRSSTSISLEDTRRTSSNRAGLVFSPSVSSTGTGERRTGSRRRQSTVMVLVTLIEKEKVIIHGLDNLCVCQIVMPKK